MHASNTFVKNYKQDGRLPPAYFAPSPFGKDAIWKYENVIDLKKKHSFSIIFTDFSNDWNFLMIFV